MKAITLTLLTVLFYSAIIYGQASYGKHKSKVFSDVQQVSSQLLQQLELAWNKADFNAFTIPFSDTLDFVDIRGTFHKTVSNHSIGKAHEELWSGIYKGSKISYALQKATLIADKNILAHAYATLDTPGGPLAGISTSTISIVITLDSGTWKVRSFHNTLHAK